jgi:DNA polymerase-3 subunit gamma/tau
VTATPCGVCDACREIDGGRFVDLLELDAASHTGIDNMREILDNARYAPTGGRYKVYLIDEVHMLSKAAFNSMLKTLEEPPSTCASCWRPPTRRRSRDRCCPAACSST